MGLHLARSKYQKARIVEFGASFVVLAMTMMSAVAAGSGRSPAEPHLPLDQVREFQPDIFATNLPNFEHARFGGRAVAVDTNPSFPNTVLVASESGGLFRSADGGTHWSRVDTFVPHRMSDLQWSPTDRHVVIATTLQTADSDFPGGIWRSSDGGITWTHAGRVEGPHPGGTGLVSCGDNYFAWGIAFAPASNDVYVGTDCGLAVSTNKGVSWTLLNLPSERVEAVVAQAGGIVDLCTQAGYRRYVKQGGLNPVGGLNKIPSTVDGDGGCTHPGAAWVHALAAPPQETGVLFTFRPERHPSACGGTPEKPAVVQVLFEGHIQADNTWKWNAIGGGCATRPPFVGTVLSRDGNPNHFDIYYAGGGRGAYRDTCNAGVPGHPGLRCDSLPAIGAPTYDGFTLAHGDVSGISFHPTQKCPSFMVSDGGVMKPHPQSGASCAASFVMAAGSGADNGGFDALQIYEVDGQVHPPSGHTDLYFGTQDNGVWASGSNGGATWPRKVGPEGLGLQMPHVASGVDNNPSVEMIFTTCGPCRVRRFARHFDVEWGDWNEPPGTALWGGPYLLPGTKTEFVQWTKTEGQFDSFFQLHRTTNFSASWQPVEGATLQTEPRAHGIVVGPTLLPVMYQPLVDGGLVKIMGLRGPQATVTDIGTGLGILGKHSAAGGSFACCESAFAAGYNNPQHLVAADEMSKQMKQSHDGGGTWQPDTELTNLVTGNGRYAFLVPWHGTQARAISFDPSNSNNILVGTESSGIIFSKDGGDSWLKLLGSAKVTAITSFFFDEVHGEIIISSFGRGLWKTPRPAN